MYTEKALQTIYQAITPNGILASSIQKDNYAKVWSRDSMMTGIVGLLMQDEKIIAAHQHSVITLAKYQSENGQIPSNVSFNGKSAEVSYGKLVGRVDATTWWIIGACMLIKNEKNQQLKTQLLPQIEKSFSCLKNWEYNNRGLLYTPLGGNWADEYITTGYTLYDNILRFWALQLAAEVYENKDWEKQSQQLKSLIETNFKKDNLPEEKYHQTAYQKAPEKPYYFSHFSANGYETLFDMAGNALALYLDFNFDEDAFENFLKSLHQEFKHWMLPVFYPIIKEEDPSWKLLENNYSYDFKNKPFHFHNGGSWPVFLGWLCLALNKKKKTEISNKITEQYEKLLQENDFQFHEYYATNDLKAEGTQKLCFSAIGYLLMKI